MAAGGYPASALCCSRMAANCPRAKARHARPIASRGALGPTPSLSLVSRALRSAFDQRVRSSTTGANCASTEARRSSDCPASRLFVRSQQARKLGLLQNHPFREAPGAAASLILKVDPMRSGTRMPKGVPEHRQIVAIRGESNDMLDANPVGIAAPKPVGYAERTALTLTSSVEEALIPPAWCQLIPDEGSDAA